MTKAIFVESNLASHALKKLYTSSEIINNWTQFYKINKIEVFFDRE